MVLLISVVLVLAYCNTNSNNEISKVRPMQQQQ